MNKKSNIIIGVSAVGVIGLAVLGMSMFTKGGESTEPLQREITVVSEPKTVEAASSVVETSQFVASKQGKKYFPVDCGTAKAIKEENKVYFGSEEEAKGAGYERSLTCK